MNALALVNRLVTQHTHLAKTICSEVCRKFPPLRRFRDDVHSGALEGLFMAAQRFDVNRGVSFVTYAWSRMLTNAYRAGMRLLDISGRLRGACEPRLADVAVLEKMHAPEHYFTEGALDVVVETIKSRVTPKAFAVWSARTFDERKFQDIAGDYGITRQAAYDSYRRVEVIVAQVTAEMNAEAA